MTEPVTLELAWQSLLRVRKDLEGHVFSVEEDEDSPGFYSIYAVRTADGITEGGEILSHIYGEERANVICVAIQRLLLPGSRLRLQNSEPMTEEVAMRYRNVRDQLEAEFANAQFNRLYLVWDKTYPPCSWGGNYLDNYDAFVICAPDEDTAKKIAQEGPPDSLERPRDPNRLSSGNLSGRGDVVVKQVGMASRDTPVGVVMGSWSSTG